MAVPGRGKIGIALADAANGREKRGQLHRSQVRAFDALHSAAEFAATSA